jgi:prolipoprotein diacylglyceryltransferase
MEFTLLGAALLGLASSWLALRLERKEKPDRALDRLIGAGVVGMLAGRLWAMISSGNNPLTHLGDVIIVRGGVDTGVASLAALLSVGWSLRTRLHLLDGLAAAALAGLAGWQAGCLLRGTCLGTATELPWGVPLAGSTVGRHPVEIYTAFLLAIGAIVLVRTRLAPGAASGLAVAWAGAARLVTQPMRPSLGAGPVLWYVAAVVVGLGVVTVTLGAGILGRSNHLPPPGHAKS